MGIPKTKLEKLYSSGKSIFEISRLLKCSPNKVVYWMRQYKIVRRTRSEANYIFNNPNGDPFDLSEINNLSKEDTFLYGLGLGLYWGEGSKRDIYALRVANTDPKLIKKFRDFLLKICHFKSDKICYGLVSFNDSSPELVRKYWAKELDISPQKFGKITQIPIQGKGNYKKKSEFGVCTIHAGNIKLKKWIMSEIEKL